MQSLLKYIFGNVPKGLQNLPIEYVKYAFEPRECHEAHIDGLAKSFEIHGMPPIYIKPNGTLIDGIYRMEAARRLGRSHVPCHIGNFRPKQIARLNAGWVALDEGV